MPSDPSSGIFKRGNVKASLHKKLHEDTGTIQRRGTRRYYGTLSVLRDTIHAERFTSPVAHPEAGALMTT